MTSISFFLRPFDSIGKCLSMTNNLDKREQKYIQNELIKNSRICTQKKATFHHKLRILEEL
jgi:hypothetical protein